MKISIIAPCYNESENVYKLYTELLPVVEDMVTHGVEISGQAIDSAEIIFVDDGSRDGTTIKLRETFIGTHDPRVAIKFLKHEMNLGLGAAIRTGFTNATGDVVVTVDSDGTYKFSEIPSLLAYLTPGIDIVTASPYHPRGNVVGVPANRLILSRGSSMIYRFLVDWKLYTYTSLFRAYRSNVIKEIHFDANDFLAGTEILVKAILNGYKATEFPAELYKRMFGVSKAKIARTIISHLRFQFWVLLQRLKSLFGVKSIQKD
jgi:dolichol-phosphate mannosyltransferase